MNQNKIHAIMILVRESFYLHTLKKYMNWLFKVHLHSLNVLIMIMEISLIFVYLNNFVFSVNKIFHENDKLHNKSLLNEFKNTYKQRCFNGRKLIASKIRKKEALAIHKNFEH